MNAWPLKTMAEVTLLVTDGKHGDCEDEENSGYYFLSSKDLRDGRLQYDKPRQITKEGFAETHRRTSLEPGDILLANCGASIGRVGMAQDEPRIYNTTFQKSISVIKANRDIVDNRFLYYFILSESSQLIRLGNGAAQPNLLIGDLKRIQVPVPSLPLQRRIAGILSSYDELIENSQQRIRILESMARALYREWFVHFRFPGHEKHPLVPSSLGNIPEGWEVKSLADLMDIQGGSQPPKSEFIYEPREGHVRLIQIRDYESDNHITYVRESPRLRTCQRVDVMIARYGASVARICSGLDGAYNVALAKVVPLIPDSREFLRQFLLDDDFQKLLVGMSGRAAQNGFNKADIAAIRLPVPCNPILLKRFERFCVPLRDSILCLDKKIGQLRRTRDLLLPRLLSGQVELKTN